MTTTEPSTVLAHGAAHGFGLVLPSRTGPERIAGEECHALCHARSHSGTFSSVRRPSRR